MFGEAMSRVRSLEGHNTRIEEVRNVFITRDYCMAISPARKEKNVVLANNAGTVYLFPLQAYTSQC